MKFIEIEPDSEIGAALHFSQGGKVAIEHRGRRFRLECDDPFWSYDAERARQAIARISGTMRGVDCQLLLKELREQRGHDLVE